MTRWIPSVLLLLALGVCADGCSGPEPAPPPPQRAEHPLERGTSEELAPPLGKPRPKLVPGDVLDREEAQQKQAADGATDEPPPDAPAEPARTE